MKIRNDCPCLRVLLVIEEGDGCHVAIPIPTQPGDVLILCTDQSFVIYVAGVVTREGQQDFDTHVNLRYSHDRAAAVTHARSFGAPGRLFLKSLDTGEWSEILN
jgi:hypothetical protein